MCRKQTLVQKRDFRFGKDLLAQSQCKATSSSNVRKFMQISCYTLCFLFSYDLNQHCEESK